MGPQTNRRIKEQLTFSTANSSSPGGGSIRITRRFLSTSGTIARTKGTRHVYTGGCTRGHATDNHTHNQLQAQNGFLLLLVFPLTHRSLLLGVLPPLLIEQLHLQQVIG